jgi:serine/threonine protein kinase
MLYLHSRPDPILHRDLKSPNLLVDESWHVKASLVLCFFVVFVFRWGCIAAAR